jgi:hypothetical protein
MREPTEGYIHPTGYYRLDDNFQVPYYHKFPVVCICGSTRFETETKQKAEDLTLQGQIVLMVNCWSKKDKLHEPQNPLDEAVKANLDAIHKEKIALSDYVLVMNVNGYWGKSTQSEIDYARKIGKPVKFIEPLSDVNNLTCDKSKEPPCHLEPSKQFCGKCPLDKSKPTTESKQ